VKPVPRPGIATVRRRQPRSQVPRSIARIDGRSGAEARTAPSGTVRKQRNGQFNFLSFQALVPWAAPPACSPALVSMYPVDVKTVNSSQTPLIVDRF